MSRGSDQVGVGTPDPGTEGLRSTWVGSVSSSCSMVSGKLQVRSSPKVRREKGARETGEGVKFYRDSEKVDWLRKLLKSPAGWRSHGRSASQRSVETFWCGSVTPSHSPLPGNRATKVSPGYRMAAAAPAWTPSSHKVWMLWSGHMDIPGGTPIWLTVLILSHMLLHF